MSRDTGKLPLFFIVLPFRVYMGQYILIQDLAIFAIYTHTMAMASDEELS